MKKINIGQAISILANLGVIAGIMFLAIELQQNNRLLESEALFNHTQTRLNVGSLHHYPHLVEIVIKKRDGLELSKEEELILFDMYANIFTAWEWEFRELQRGALAELPVEGYREVFAPTGVDRYPGIAETWELRKLSHSADFVRWMEANVVSPGAQE